MSQKRNNRSLSSGVAFLAALLAVGACDRTAPAPAASESPAGTYRVTPGDTKQEARDGLQREIEKQWTGVEEIRGELRVVRRSNQHIWACNAYVATPLPRPSEPGRIRPPAPGRYQLTLVAAMTGQPGENSSQNASLSVRPLTQGASAASGDCDAKLASEFPDIGTSVLDRLLP